MALPNNPNSPGASPFASRVHVQAQPTARKGLPAALIAGAAAAVLVVGAAIWLLSSRKDSPAARPAPTAATVPPPAATVTSAPAPASIVPSGPLPIFEEQFNATHKGIRLANGAERGGAASGVSGKADDLAYMGKPRSLDHEPGGPAAVAMKPIATKTLPAFTCTLWYRLDEPKPDLQVFIDGSMMTLLLHDRGFEVRVNSEPKQGAYFPGAQGPLESWTAAGRWIFAALTWDAESNTLSVYQATPQAPVTFMREMKRPAPALAMPPRANLADAPETLANSFTRFERPVAGSLDNFRVFDRTLEKHELEKIRTADLENRPLLPR